MQPPYTLYGMPGSLYTSKVRAYLRHNQINFVEERPGSHRFNTVVSQAVNRWIIPVIETPSREFIQDGTVILDHFDKKGFSKNSIFPPDPKLKVVAHLFELFGGEGLLRPAMHYRWNFDETNLSFLKTVFADVLPDNLSKDDWDVAFEKSSGRMRKAAVIFGVTPKVYSLIEQSYLEFLNLLNIHLTQWHYLFGEYPTIGDYGLFNPLYAHLGRDPKPLHLMQTKAPQVFRWTERMNAPESKNLTQSVSVSSNLSADFAIPETLTKLMRFIAVDYLPELEAHIRFANEWLKANRNPSQAYNPKSRAIGLAEFGWRGHSIRTSVMPYRFFLLQRLQDTYESLDRNQQSDVLSVFESVGLETILHLKTSRRVVRENYLEVWQ